MKPNFGGAKLKVKRAYQHITELEVWLRETVQNNIDAFLAQPRANDWEDKFTNPGPIIGDIVHNLRCALDHCAFAICGDTANEPEKVYFPLGDTRDGLIATREFIAIQRAQPSLATVIADVIKPYKAANPGFWALNQLDRMDKHRLLLPTEYRIAFQWEDIKEEQEDNPPPIKLGLVYRVVRVPRLKNSLWPESARAPHAGTRASSENQRNGQLATKVLFRDAPVFQNEPIIPTLHQLAELISEAVRELDVAVI